eukprot:gene2787-3580_t
MSRSFAPEKYDERARDSDALSRGPALTEKLLECLHDGLATSDSFPYETLVRFFVELALSRHYRYAFVSEYPKKFQYLPYCFNKFSGKWQALAVADFERELTEDFRLVFQAYDKEFPETPLSRHLANLVQTAENASPRHHHHQTQPPWKSLATTVNECLKCDSQYVSRNMLTPDAFWRKLDAAADHMLGFDNGVYDLARERFVPGDEIDPDDYFVSMSVRYDYEAPNATHLCHLQELDSELLKKLFPNAMERTRFYASVASLLSVGDVVERIISLAGKASAGKATCSREIVKSVLGDYASLLEYTTREKKTNVPNISSGRKERVLALKALPQYRVDSDAYVIKCVSKFDHAITKDNPAKRLYKRQGYDDIERFAAARAIVAI